MASTMDHAEQALKTDKVPEVKVDLAKAADSGQPSFNQAHSEAKTGSLSAAQSTVDKCFGSANDLISGVETKPQTAARDQVAGTDKGTGTAKESGTGYDKATGTTHCEAQDKDNNKTVLNANKDGSYALVTKNSDGKETHSQSLDAAGNTTNKETDPATGNYLETKVEAKSGNKTITSHDEAAGTDISSTTDPANNLLQTKIWNSKTGFDSTTTFDKESGSTHTVAFDKDNNQTVSDTKRDGSYNDVKTNDQGQEIQSSSKDSAGNTRDRQTDPVTGNYTESKSDALTGNTTTSIHNEKAGTDETTTQDSANRLLESNFSNSKTGYRSHSTYDPATLSEHTVSFDKDNNKTVSDIQRDGSYSDVKTNKQGQEIHSESKDSAGTVTTKDTDPTTGDYTKTEKNPHTGIETDTKHDGQDGHDEIRKIGKDLTKAHGDAPTFAPKALFPTLKPGAVQDNSPAAETASKVHPRPVLSEDNSMPDTSAAQKQFDQDKTSPLAETQMSTVKAQMDLGIKSHVAGEQTIKAAQDAILNGDAKALGQDIHNFKGDVKGLTTEINSNFEKQGARVKVDLDQNGQVQIQDSAHGGAYDLSIDPKSGKVEATYDNMGRNMNDGTISVDPDTALGRIGTWAASDILATDQWQPGMR